MLGTLDKTCQYIPRSMLGTVDNIGQYISRSMLVTVDNGCMLGTVDNTGQYISSSMLIYILSWNGGKYCPVVHSLLSTFVKNKVACYQHLRHMIVMNCYRYWELVKECSGGCSLLEHTNSNC